MLKYYVVAITLITSVYCELSWAAIETGSQISQVTVYPDSARVVRTLQVELPAGKSQVVITDLPISLDESSLQISGESAAEVSLGTVQFKQAIAQERVQAREQALLDEINSWQRQRQEVVDLRKRAEQQLEFIRHTGGLNQQDTPEGGSNALPLEQWQQAWSMLDSATAQAQQSIREANQSLQGFDKGITQLEEQLAQIASGETRSRSASLAVQATTATQLKLAISYQIQGASWSPVYSASLDTQQQQLTLKTQAQIQQRTGEDWEAAAITLSTLRPASGSQMPELESWFINFDEDYIEYSYSAEEPAAADMARVMAKAAPVAEVYEYEPASVADEPKPVKPLQELSSALLSGQFNAEYQIPGKMNLASGSDSQRVTLESHSLNADIVLSSVPRFDPRAMITAEANYTGEAPLIPGEVSLYRDGSFVGKTALNALQTGELLKLSFGEDDRFKVKFTAAAEQQAEKGLLGATEVLTRAYLITVENHHEQPRVIILYDNVPVSEHDDIKVSLGGEKPYKQDVSDKQGIISWKKELAKGNKMTIKYSYMVSYPKGKTPQGL